MLAVLVLLLLLIVLVLFSMQKGFSVLEHSGSQLMVFVAINVNIVLLAIVFYLLHEIFSNFLMREEGMS